MGEVFFPTVFVACERKAFLFIIINYYYYFVNLLMKQDWDRNGRFLGVS